MLRRSSTTAMIILLWTTTFLPLCVVQSSPLLEAFPDDCHEYTTCLDCLGSSSSSKCSGWAVGQCLSSCSVIADAPCYRLNGDNKTAQQVCQMMEDDERNRQTCSAVSSSGSCSECVQTKLLDGISTCHWIQPEFSDSAAEGFCSAEACTMVGCGTTTCEDDTTTPDETTTPLSCSSIASCEECLENSSSQCGIWSNTKNQCVSTCEDDPNPTANCYSTDNPRFRDKSVTEICEIMNANKPNDPQTCPLLITCSNCAEKIANDNTITSCYWPEYNGGTCIDSEFAMVGFGKLTCTDANTCSVQHLTCQDCYTADGCEAWAIGECLSSCYNILEEHQDCYNLKDYTGLPLTNICQVMQQDKQNDQDNKKKAQILLQNQERCSNPQISSCTECVETILLLHEDDEDESSSSSCVWSEEEESCQYDPECSSSSNMDCEGTTTCDADANVMVRMLRRAISMMNRIRNLFN